MHFRQAYAGEAVCAPSRCTFITGLHTGHSPIRGNFGVQGHDFPLPTNYSTVAQILRDYGGYKTALVGKWGLGYNNTVGAPRKHGFDYYYGQLDQKECHNYYPPFIWENENKILLPENTNASRDLCMSSPSSCSYTMDLFTNKALEYLKNQTKSDKPFFLFLAHTVPHAGGWKGYEESGAPVPSDGQYVDKPWPNVEKDHAAMITRQDSDIGKVLNLIKSEGLDSNTIVFFASDNGAHNEGNHNYKFFDSSGPLRGFKRSLYEGGIRSPIIVRWPGNIPPNTVSNYNWAFWDLLPTFAELASVPSDKLPKNLDGISIVPTLLGKNQPPKPFLYWEFCTHNAWGHAVRMGKWKGVSFSLSEPMELYDLDVDEGESNNLASQYPEIVKQLETQASKAHQDDVNWPKVNCHSS